MKSLIWVFCFCSFFGVLSQESQAAEKVSLQIVDASNNRDLHYVDFGMVPIMQSRFMTIRLQNTGYSPLTNLHFRLSGYGFYGTTTCSMILSGGNQCYIDLEFRPNMQGWASGYLDILSYEYQNRIRLSGQGY